MIFRCEQWRRQVVVLALVSCCVGVAFAQQPFGIIVGKVTDPIGATLPATTIMVTNVETQVSQTVVTNATGDYSVPYLVNGTYTIKAEQAGFRTTVISRVVVRAAQTVRADIRMEVGEIREVSEVSATGLALQTDTAAVGTTIDSRLLNELPLNGRTFAQLATLVPGVAPQGQLNIATSRRRGSIGTSFAITANGFSDVQNNFIYDGVPAMDLDSYNFAFSPSIDAISEFKVQTNSYSSAYGGAPTARAGISRRPWSLALHSCTALFATGSFYTLWLRKCGSAVTVQLADLQISFASFFSINSDKLGVNRS